MLVTVLPKCLPVHLYVSNGSLPCVFQVLLLLTIDTVVERDIALATGGSAVLLSPGILTSICCVATGTVHS